MTEDVQNSQVSTTRPAEQSKGWAASVTPASRQEAVPGEPQNFVQRIIPKSKKGKVVFAAATAQVASMVVVPMFWSITKNLIPDALQKLTGHLANVFEKKPQMMNGILESRTWDGLFDPESLDRWVVAKGRDRFEMQAGKLIEMGIQGAYNISSTMWVRNTMDKALKINAGSGAVARTQAWDTLAAMIALIGIPRFLPDQSMKWRMGLRKIYKPVVNATWFWEKDPAKREMFTRDAAFYTVNLSFPDLLGFSVGIASMLNAVNDKAEQSEKDKNNGPSRA